MTWIALFYGEYLIFIACEKFALMEWDCGYETLANTDVWLVMVAFDVYMPKRHTTLTIWRYFYLGRFVMTNTNEMIALAIQPMYQKKEKKKSLML